MSLPEGMVSAGECAALVKPASGKPLTMSEEQERADRNMADSFPCNDQRARAWAEIDALRAALSASEERYAEAVLALDGWRSQLSGTPKRCGHDFNCVCPGESAEAILSTPAARAVLEVKP